MELVYPNPLSSTEDQEKQEIEQRYELAKEHMPELVELMRQAYNMGFIKGKRNLIEFHIHHQPPYGIKTCGCFSASNYDPFTLSPYVVKSPARKPTLRIIKVTKLNVEKYYAKRTVHAPTRYGGGSAQFWQCRRCRWISHDRIPPEHKCLAVDK